MHEDRDRTLTGENYGHMLNLRTELQDPAQWLVWVTQMEMFSIVF